MRSGRAVRRVALAGGLGLVSLLPACGLLGADGDLQTTALDVERASAAWSDPWAAPDAPTLPGADAQGTNPVRLAGTRTTEHPAGRDATDAAASEAEAAEAAGWSVLGAACGAGEVEVALGRGSTVDDGARATLVATTGRATTVEVDVEVAHHADGAWPATEPVAVTDTCLAGGGGGDGGGGDDTLPAEPAPDAYDPGGGEPGPDEAVEWERSEPTGSDTALRDALAADPWYAGLGAEPGDEPAVEPGPDERSGPVALAEVTVDADDPASALSEVVADMTSWEVTWVTCGPGTPAAASARLVTPEGAVTARLESADGAAVAVEVRLPVPEAPPFAAVTDPPALDAGGACLDGREPRSPTVEGAPVAVPGPLTPYLG